MCDATPDVSNLEQNVLLLRYVSQTSPEGGWEINERFLEFKDFSKKTGEEITTMVEQSLGEHGIDIADCRGQCYDNWANMAGKVRGVQACILNKNPLATYSPCASHTLKPSWCPCSPGLPRNRHILWLLQSAVQTIQWQPSPMGNLTKSFGLFSAQLV